MKKLDTDRIVSLSAMVIGISSLFVVVYQTYLERVSQRAAVMPYLTVAMHSNDRYVGLALSNVGLGPALVNEVRVRYRGRDIESDPYDFFLQERPDVTTQGLAVDKIQAGRLMPAGTTSLMLSIESEVAESRARIHDELLRLFEIAEVPKRWYVAAGATGTEKAVFEVTYSSVYGQQWRIRSDQLVPEEM